MEYTRDEIKEIIKVTILCILTVITIAYSFWLDEKTKENTRDTNYNIVGDKVIQKE